MIRRQPNRAAAILAAAIGVTGVLGRELMRRNVSSTLEHVVFGLMMLLAIAYLVSVFFVKPDQKRKNDQPLTQADEWLKNGLIDKQEYEAIKNRKSRTL